MIVATPRNWLRQEYDLADADGDGAPFGEVGLRLFGGGRLTIGAADFDLLARSTGTRYELARGAHTVAVAARPSIFRRHFLVEAGNAELEMTATGWFGTHWDVTEHGAPIGEARWTGEIRSRLRLTLPDDVPLVAQAFLAAVAIAERRRQGRS